MTQFFTTLMGTTVIMLVAEFGDKTNLVALSLMSETKKPFTVALGATIGISLVSIIAVLIGFFIGNSLPINIISILAGLIFIALGIWSLFGEEDEEDEVEEADEKSVVSSSRLKIITRSISLIALAEIGDKSQIFIITASASSIPLAVLIGSMIGMGIIMFSTALIGQSLIMMIDEEKVEFFAGILFIVAGLWIIIIALSNSFF